MMYLEAKQQFAEYVKSYCANDTIEYYMLNLEFFERYLLKTFLTLDFEVEKLKKAHFIGYINNCREKCVKNTSVRTYARAVKVFLRYLYFEGILDNNITLNVKFPKSDKKQVIPLSSERVNKLYKAIATTSCCERNKAIFSLMLDCGLRVGEVVRLNMCDLDFENDCIRIIDTKNSKSRIVPLPVKVKKYIKEYLNKRKTCDFALFLDIHNKERITENAIAQFMYKLKYCDSDIHAHLLRHTFATSFIMGGGQLEILRVLMGHEDYAITKDYLHLASQLGIINYDIYRLDGIIFNRYIAYNPKRV